MVDSKVVDKAKKILALATNNKNVHEREVAMLKLQEHLAKHGLEMAELEATNERPDKEVVKEVAIPAKRTQWYENDLFVLIANNFRCKGVINSSYQRKSYSFIGLKEDVAVAKEVYKFALDTMEYGVKQYMKDVSVEAPRKYRDGLRNDYRAGFMKGLQKKFKDQVEREGWGLVLVVDALVMQAHEKATQGRQDKTMRSVARNHNEHALLSGFERGYNMTDGNTKLIDN